MARLIHAASGRVLADHLEVASAMRERMRGLLGRTGLPPGGGMLIERCSSIHTFFMKFSLDIIFVDSQRTVRKVVRNLRPWRLASAFGASDVVELPAGALAEVLVVPGDALTIEEWK